MAADKDETRFERIATRFGVPTAMAFMLLLFIGSVSWWTASNIVKPWSERHLQFVDDVDRTNGDLSNAVLKQADAVLKQGQLEERRTKVLEENAQLMRSLEQNQKLLIELYKEQRATTRQGTP